LTLIKVRSGDPSQPLLEHLLKVVQPLPVLQVSPKKVVAASLGVRV
jgi:hypothetical protein